MLLYCSILSMSRPSRKTANEILCALIFEMVLLSVITLAFRPRPGTLFLFVYGSCSNRMSIFFSWTSYLISSTTTFGFCAFICAILRFVWLHACLVSVFVLTGLLYATDFSSYMSLIQVPGWLLRLWICPLVSS